MRHTPGPWEANYGGVISANHTETYIARAEEKAEGYRVPISHEERLANSKLIAAAPTLLEACKAAIPIIGKDLNPTDNPAFSVLDLLRAAIAKAEGEI